MRNHLLISLIFICSVAELFGQNVTILGPTSANYNQEKSYSLSFPGGTPNMSQADYGWTASSTNVVNDTGIGLTANVIWKKSGSQWVAFQMYTWDNIYYDLHTVTVSGGPPPPAPSAPTVSSTGCGSVTLQRSGSPPSGTTWYWQKKTSNGTATNLGSGATVTFNNTTSGNYYIRAYNSSGWGGQSYRYASIPQNPPQPTAYNRTHCGSSSVTLSATSGYNEYRWYLNGSTSSYVSSTSSTHSVSTTNLTSYRVKVRNGSCWSGLSNTSTVTDIGPDLSGLAIIGDSYCQGQSGGDIIVATEEINGFSAYNSSTWFRIYRDGAYVIGFQASSAGSNAQMSFGPYTVQSGSSDTYVLKVQRSGCSEVELGQNATITETAQAVIAIDQGEEIQTICQGQNFVIETNSSFARLYGGPTGGSVLGSADGNGTITSSLGGGTYWVGLLPGTCVNITREQVQINSIPVVGTPSISSGVSHRWQGSGTTDFNATASSATNYIWSISPASAGTINANGTITWAGNFSNSTATISVTATNTCSSNTASTTVWVEPIPTISIMGNTHLAALGDHVTLYTAPAYTTYNWKKDGVTVSTASNYIVNVEGSYTLIVTKLGLAGSATSLAIVVTGCGEVDPGNYNYFTTTTMRDAVSDESAISVLTSGQRDVAIQYFDGLGRPIQNVNVEASPLKEHVVQPIAYDPFGRRVKEYLPYVVTDNCGLFQSNAVGTPSLNYTDYTSSPHYNFYQTATDIAHTTAAYSEAILEPSPLNRVLKQGAPGTAWRPDPDPTVTTDDVVRYGYEVNVLADEVYIWDIATGVLSIAGHYPTGELTKTVTTDEEGHAVIEFVNKLGQTVLKRVQAVETSNLTNYTLGEWADTYYLYDDYGNLRYVLPPEAIEELNPLATSFPYAPSPTLLTKWAFQYNYDGRRRMTEKKVPGADWVYMVYDNRDRLVLTQDGNQRMGTKNEWTFTKYDILNRPILMGIIDKGSTTLSVIRTEVAGVSTFCEFRGATVHGYTNNAYPTVSTANAYLTVTYYDDYTFPHASGYPFVPELGNTSAFDSVKGQVTGTKTKALDGSNTWLESVTYYDDRYRVIQTQTQTFIGGVDRVSNRYDFIGQVLETKTVHETPTTFDVEWTDIIGASVNADNTLTKTLGNAWNAGAGSVNLLAAGENGWVEMEVQNTSAHMIFGLSDTNPSVNYTTLDYGFYLRVGGSIRIYENGANRGTFGSYGTGDKVRVERIGDTIYYKKNGSVFYSSTVPSTTALIADVSLYTTGATIANAKSSFGPLNSKEHITVTREFDYDHAGRLIDTWHEISELVTPINDLGIVIEGNVIRKNQPISLDNSGFASSQRIPAEQNGWIEVEVLETNKGRTFGLSEIDDGIRASTIDYGIVLGVNDIQISENGAVVTGYGSYAQGDIFCVERKEGTIYYKKNGVVFETSSIPSTSSLLGDFNLLHEGATFYNVTISTEGKVLLVHNEYNELGELIEKNLHSEDNGQSFAQSIDYRYNIRGWLTSINNAQLANTADNNDTGQNQDYWGMELGYNNALSGVTATAAFNGNISAVKWSDNLGMGGATDITERAYAYTYDAMNRIKTANHSQYTSVWTPNNHFQLSGLTYDLNGNIETLTRKNQQGSTMDALAYTYTGNQLLRVADTGLDEGFKDGTNGGDDYLYDDNGNMKQDLNKDITTITYNHLNLPARVEKDADNYILYTYDAAGIKLRQEVYEGGTLTKTTDYVGEFIYENNELQLIQHEEGRIVPDPATGNYDYEYALRDHLGNTRVMFTTNPKTIDFTLNYESNSADPDDETLFDNLQNVITADIHDRVDAGNESFNHQNVQALNGATNGVIGSVLTIPVGAGDKVSAEVYAKYLAPTGTNNPAAAVGSLVIAAITGSTGTNNYEGAINSGYGSGGTVTNLIDASASGTEPMAFINLLFLPDDVTGSIATDHFAFKQVTSASSNNQAVLALDQPYEAPEAGYVVVYLSNESAQLTEVYFDDLKVTVEEHPVTETNAYYPFGMIMSGNYQRITAQENRFKYNGKELIQDLDLGWLDYGARMYMAEIGRFNQIDVKADIYRSYTPYAYSLNNPVLFVDKNGEGPKPKNKGVKISVNSIDNTRRINKELHKGTAAGRQKALEIAFYSVSKSYDNNWHETAYEDAEFTETGKAAEKIDSKFDGIEVYGQAEDGSELFLFRVENTGGGFVESIQDFIGTDEGGKTRDASELEKYLLENLDQEAIAELGKIFGNGSADPTGENTVRGGQGQDGDGSSGGFFRRKGYTLEELTDPSRNDTIFREDGSVRQINRYTKDGVGLEPIYIPPKIDFDNDKK